jgi:hypothetical protein
VRAQDPPFAPDVPAPFMPDEPLAGQTTPGTPPTTPDTSSTTPAAPDLSTVPAPYVPDAPVAGQATPPDMPPPGTPGTNTTAEPPPAMLNSTMAAPPPPPPPSTLNTTNGTTNTTTTASPPAGPYLLSGVTYTLAAGNASSCRVDSSSSYMYCTSVLDGSTLPEQFKPCLPNMTVGVPILVGDQLILKSRSTGKYCRLDADDSNIPRVKCDTALYLAATSFVYDGNGLTYQSKSLSGMADDMATMLAGAPNSTVIAFNPVTIANGTSLNIMVPPGSFCRVDNTTAFMYCAPSTTMGRCARQRGRGQSELLPLRPGARPACVGNLATTPRLVAATRRRRMLAPTPPPHHHHHRRATAEQFLAYDSSIRPSKRYYKSASLNTIILRSAVTGMYCQVGRRAAARPGTLRQCRRRTQHGARSCMCRGQQAAEPGGAAPAAPPQPRSL